MFIALHNRRFRFLWLGSLLWSTSRWIETVVLGWLVLDITGSPFMVGLVIAMRNFPFLLFGAIGGVVADRVNSRPRLLAAAQLCVVILTSLMAALTIYGLVQVWHLVVLAFLSGTAMAFDQPTRQSLVYDLVKENLVNALALNASAFNLARILGPAAGGIMLGLIGPGGCFLVMVAIYLVGVFFLIMIGSPARTRSASNESAWQNLKEGIRYVISSPVPRTLLMLEAVADIVAVPYMFVLMPVFARDVMVVGPTGLGFMTASIGLGALSGAMGLAWMGNHIRKGPAMLVTALGYGLFLFLFSVSSWYPLSLVLLTILGATSAIQSNLVAILLQTTVPEEMRGRLMGAYVLTWGLMPFGNLQAGAVASVLGAPFVGATGGLLLLAFTVFVIGFFPALRRV